MDWRETAWNGVRCEIPDSWEVVKIGRRYLMFAEKSAPMMEIKWGQIRGKFSHHSQLRRLAMQQRKKFGKTLKEIPLPPEWRTPLSEFISVAFSWHSQTISGSGAVLYCPTCKTATLMQFFQKHSAHSTALVQHILGSFQDHSRDNRVIWALFDIRALIPAEFDLIKYRFDAGQYELIFSYKKQKITLWRWVPASVLLHKQNLEEFAHRVTRFALKKTVAPVRADPDWVEWEVLPSTPWWSRWRSRRLLGHAPTYYRFWHLREKNRIFGVKIEGKQAIDSEFVNSICAGYGSV